MRPWNTLSGGNPIAYISLDLKVPHIPNQDASVLDQMPVHLKVQRKAIHVVCNKTEVKHVQDLMRIAKD